MNKSTINSTNMRRRAGLPKENDKPRKPTLKRRIKSPAITPTKQQHQRLLPRRLHYVQWILDQLFLLHIVVIATSPVAHTNGHQHGEQTQDYSRSMLNKKGSRQPTTMMFIRRKTVRQEKPNRNGRASSSDAQSVL